jgi:type I restriction enzyme S subunit
MAFTMTVAELIDADTSGLLAKHATWERVSLESVARILNGAPFDSTLFSTAGGMPLVRIRDVTTGQTNTHYTGPYEDLYLVNQGDLLVGMDGDFNTGLWGSEAALLNQRVCKLTPNEKYYDKRFLAFALPGYLAAINAHTPSVTVKHLSSKTIGEIGLPLPPRAEQTRIVEKLEELLSDLDAGVAELKAAQKKLGQYRQSLLKAAVEGSLTAEWRSKNTPAETGAQLLERILTERRARWEAKQLARFKEQGKTPSKDWQTKYPEPVQPDTTDLPELPQGWVWASVEQLSELMSGNTPKDAEARATVSGVIPWFKVGDMNRGGNEVWLCTSQINFSREDATAIGMKIAPAGTIVFPKRGGAIATNKKRRLKSEACFDLNTMGLVPVSLAAEWLWWWFQGIDLGRLSDGSNVPQINNPDIAPLLIPIPPMEEQEMIICQLQMALDATHAQEVAINQSLKQSTAQRQNILRAAFAGQLVPQDPNDEPAAVLLARIRAERTTRDAVKKPRGRRVKGET